MIERRPVGLVLLGILAASPAHAQGIGLEQLKDMMSWGTSSLVVIDQLELGAGMEGTPILLESIGWVGGATNRAWFRVEGEHLVDSSDGEVEAHVYYGRLVAPFWDVLVGVRGDQQWGDDGETRGHLAVGLVGMSPLRFELAPTIFLSHEGDLSARFEAEYQLLVTQQLVVEPEVEVELGIGDAPEWGVGTGLQDLELGLRVRYLVVREFAPYVGVRWERSFGETADLARATSEPVSDAALVAGARIWW